MNDRDRFVSARRASWDELERLVHRAASPQDWSRLAARYREVCGDLSRAKALDLGEDVSGYLDDLSSRAHHALYGARAGGRLRIFEVLAFEAPRELRAQWRTFALALALFYGPGLLGFAGALMSSEFAASVLPPDTLASMEAMYRTSDVPRAAGEDAAMAGFYVLNNVGIALRCFATGVLFGLGPLFYLPYNGLVIGTVAGYLTSVGYGGNLLTFTAGHSAWELTGVVVAGTAGLRLGWALVETEGKTRAASLRAVGPSVFRLVVGAASMLLVAAAIEGFWSASPLPPPIKWAFGVVQVAAVVAWIVLGGRR
jgi:uncharacterized membrane protein SpoIIM required for sporulation